MVQRIKLAPSGILNKLRPFGVQLFDRSRPHWRHIQLCLPSRVGTRVANWLLRKRKRRQIKRLKRIHKMWEPYIKKKRLNDKQVKQIKQRELMEEIHRRAVQMTPRLRMVEKHLKTGLANPYLAAAKRNAIRKQVIKEMLEERDFLQLQLRILRSKVSRNRMERERAQTKYLLNMKRKLDVDYKEALADRKLMKRKVIAKRKELLKLSVFFADYYKKIKTDKNITVPRFFSVIEKNRFQEKSLVGKATLKQHCLQVTAAASKKFLELQKASDELRFYVRTRFFFFIKMSKILNQLDSTKNIMVEFMRDGHEQLTYMFKMLHEIEEVRNAQTIMDRLIQQRLDLEHQRAVLKPKVEAEYMRHATYKYPSACTVKFFHESEVVNSIEKNLRNPNEDSMLYLNYLTLERAEFLKWCKYGKNWWKREKLNYSGEKDIKIWNDFKADNFWNDFVVAYNMVRGNAAVFHAITAPQRFYFTNKTALLDETWFVHHCLILKRSVSRLRDIIYYNFMYVLAMRGYQSTLKPTHNWATINKQRHKVLPAIFKSTKRKRGHRAGKLGIPHKFNLGNIDQCTKTEFKYFLYFIAIRYFQLSPREYLVRTIQRRKREKAHRDEEMKRILVGKFVSKAKRRHFSIYDIKYETYCSYCCGAERREKLKSMNKTFEDRTVDEVRRDLCHTYFGPPQTFLIHEFEHCPQAEALFVHKLRILRDRTNLGDDEAWIKWE